jgi:hypothetical protein
MDGVDELRGHAVLEFDGEIGDPVRERVRNLPAYAPVLAENGRRAEKDNEKHCQ